MVEDAHDEGPPARDRDDLVVEMASLGRPNNEIGPAVDRSAKYVQRRLKDPVIARRVADRRAERINDAVGRLSDSVLDAIDIMRNELDADRSGDRLRAAALIVNSLVKVREQAQVDQTVDELRAEIAELRDLVKGN